MGGGKGRGRESTTPFVDCLAKWAYVLADDGVRLGIWYDLLAQRLGHLFSDKENSCQKRLCERVVSRALVHRRDALPRKATRAKQLANALTNPNTGQKQQCNIQCTQTEVHLCIHAVMHVNTKNTQHNGFLLTFFPLNIRLIFAMRNQNKGRF